jgi:hypothetical protein
VTTAYKIACSGRYNTKNNFLVSWWNSEIYIQSLYKFKKQKELDGGVAGQQVLLYYNKRLSIIQVGGDDTVVIFGINRSGVFGRGI